ncbi:TfoX/Sxy family protein [Nocardioides sp. GY 10113]|uniref:TfoX/Sxy family protein n=1 Tax=Nocardioides sp. GY 10113 TaxID=2569761 RepID=UPI0010A7C9AB|nr:TfoX/Sxy family protein [Nocardioides sp. GY 10113]TIC80609.1 TfoX/Sxy family protein [Nocardioides sp. GY 10113]
MAYDEALATRIREMLEGSPGLTEKRMFGGLAFLLDGNMAVVASGQGGLMVRVGDAAPALLGSTPAVPVEMRGRPMSGWLRVDTDQLDDDATLAEWVERGAAFARLLPAK